LGNHYTVPRRGIYLKVKEVEKVERGRGRKKMMVSPEQDRIDILVERDKLLIENQQLRPEAPPRTGERALGYQTLATNDKT
jgi:hypothetical protein